ncbi:MAG: hypothetical protein LBD23_02685 [Oscillospiraceae bacterium]|nr:hypothetical protein [Oscillospiraceae bacterium]
MSFVLEFLKSGNAFWEFIGYTKRPDLVYKNKATFPTIRDLIALSSAGSA